MIIQGHVNTLSGQDADLLELNRAVVCWQLGVKWFLRNNSTSSSVSFRMSRCDFQNKRTPAANCASLTAYTNGSNVIQSRCRFQLRLFKLLFRNVEELESFFGWFPVKSAILLFSKYYHSILMLLSPCVIFRCMLSPCVIFRCMLSPTIGTTLFVKVHLLNAFRRFSTPSSGACLHTEFFVR
jgi:hypothetical protein